MIQTKFIVNGIEYSDYKNITINRTSDGANAASSFDAFLDSPFGRHKTDFIVGQEVIFYADQNVTPTTILFKGVLEKVVFSGEETTQTVELSGRDYSVRLMDMTVEPIVFTDTEISDIVKNILSNNQVPDITTTNVQNTGIILKRKGFNHTPIFDAIKELADLAGFIFYVDNNKDLHFEQVDSSSSGVTLDNLNLITSDFDKSRQGMANMIWVYGDRYLTEAPNEKFMFGSPTGGSFVTLQWKPHNTKVSYLGSVLKGSIDGMTIIPVSGADYGVSYDDQQVIFYSGTGFPKFPISGGSVIIAYDKDLPIVKYGQDDISVSLYGPKVLKIQDNSIKDPQTAMDILKQKLNDSNPLDRVKCKIKGWYSINPSQTINLVLDNFNLNQQLAVLEINYKFDKNSIQTEKIMNLTISKKFLDITDKLKDLNRRLNLLESQNLLESDMMTRLFSATGSIQFVGSNWNIYQRYTGSDFLWGKGNWQSTSGTGGLYWDGTYAYSQVKMFSGT